ncbi:MAG: FMN-binding protein [Proteobacteria bacterium]|nr:FMN-binding protein [Pseudomonadota bacterium]
MKWQPFLGAPLAALSVSAYATQYFTVEQAQARMFPGAKLAHVPLQLDDAIRGQLHDASGIHEPFNEDGVWKVDGGGWFIVDKVVGKHEMITYAVSLTASGAVKDVEILDYRETYGYEVRKPEWRAQFTGKTAADPVKLGQDIRNISGATLSSKHITQGVKRVLALYLLVLSKQ